MNEFLASMVSARDALIAFVIRAAGAVQAIVALGRGNGAAAAVAITTGAVICPDLRVAGALHQYSR